MAVYCILDYPMGGEGFQQGVIFKAVPSEGDWIDFGEDWPSSFPGRGASFQVKHVCWPVEGPDDERSHPRIIIKL